MCFARTTFNSIEWILLGGGLSRECSRHSLSIPLNGFEGCTPPLLLVVVPSFNSIEWILESSYKYSYRYVCAPLSIPLYGFTVHTPALTPSTTSTSSFNSIVWILVACDPAEPVDYDFQFHCMDSIPLSPRAGAPCIWSRI